LWFCSAAILRYNAESRLQAAACAAGPTEKQASVSDLAKLYQEQILEHHRAPRNAGRLPDPTHSAEAHNPLCGDRVRLTLRLGILPAAAGALAEPAAARVAETATAGAVETATAAPVQTATGPLGVLEARCDTQGCALCRASGSMLTELIIGQGVLQVTAWLERFLALAGTPPGSHEGEDAVLVGAVQPLLEVRKFPSRRRCVTLGWEALRAALQEPKQEPK
jgi:nitrogen fixation NifU-like protein